jgi:hypothetical protein
MIFTRSSVAVGDLLRAVPLSEADIEALAGLTEGYLFGDAQPIRLVPRGRQPSVDPGRIITFPSRD